MQDAVYTCKGLRSHSSTVNAPSPVTIRGRRFHVAERIMNRGPGEHHVVFLGVHVSAVR